MSEIRNRDRILEAIDQLRRRKARPDIQRICTFLMRRFSVTFAETKADLQKCVDNDIVLRVEYKGNISYRNAAKKYSIFKRGNQTVALAAKVNRKFAALLTNAIAELIVHEPDYLELGVPGTELIKNILSKDNVRYTKKYVSILLDKEVENGGLIKMENGNYLVGPATKDLSISENSCDDSSSGKNTPISSLKPTLPKEKKRGPKTSSKGEKSRNIYDPVGRNDKSEKNASLRVGSRRKRAAKKVFDPSDNNLPKKRGRPAGSLNRNTIEKHMAKSSEPDSRPGSRASNSNRDQGGVCCVCHNNKKVPNDRFVACPDCINKAHISCLNVDDMMLRINPDSTWKCPYCKACVVCYETQKAGHLTICSVCTDAYHATCHEPAITEKVKNGTKWLCTNCQMSEQLVVNEIHHNVGNDEMGNKLTIAYGPIDVDEESRSASPSSSDDSGPPNIRSLPSSPTPPTLSPQAIHNSPSVSPSSLDLKCVVTDPQCLRDIDLDDLVDPSIPDASTWTCEEVYNYFAQYFPEEASIFRDQDIDGRSLLLMRRSDVLTNLNLKLGAALKIYRHVVKLQFRSDNPKLYWL